MPRATAAEGDCRAPGKSRYSSGISTAALPCSEHPRITWSFRLAGLVRWASVKPESMLAKEACLPKKHEFILPWFVAVSSENGKPRPSIKHSRIPMPFCVSLIQDGHWAVLQLLHQVLIQTCNWAKLPIVSIFLPCFRAILYFGQWKFKFCFAVSIPCEIAPDYVLMQHYALILKGPYFRDRVPIGTFLTFWVPIHISGSLFSAFWLNSRK